MAKYCRICSLEKNDDDFYVNPKHGWIESTCKSCRNKKHNERNKNLVLDGKCRRCGDIRDDLLKVYCSACRKLHSEWLKEDRKKRPEFYRSREKENNKKIREIIFNHYGKICDCCGENRFEFLVIDHINGGGNKHRRDNNITGGSRSYRWLLKNNFPDGFRTLCHSCNFSLGAHGYCPHDKEKVNLLDFCIKD